MTLHQTNRTAILVFANSSGEELKYKSIHKGANLFEALTNHTLEITAKAQLPYFHFSEEKQVGNTFGNRFINAIQTIFEKGYEQIITIGNDTPQLTTAHILEAEKQLNSNKPVLGPSADGGFYLMGLHKSQFDAYTFEQLAWQTSDLSKQLLALINQGSTEVVKLCTLHDIDTQTDVKLIISYTYRLSKKLLRALINAIGLQKISYLTSFQKFQPLSLRVRRNKGSPLVFSL